MTGADVVVAIVDDDIDALHPEFLGRVMPGYHASPDDERPARVRHRHGTKVAGLVLAGGREVTGIAPHALLMPVTVPALATVVGHPAEAEGLQWAADHGADVICCAWAPPNAHSESGRLPALTCEALDYCTTRGRDGKGCVVVFSAGNDGGDLSLNGYASHPNVIAVGACNVHGEHPAYSGRGDALWCVFPSNDPRDRAGRRMTYATTVPIGSLADGEAFYTTRFGFTSAACAAVAGICALIVSANPSLTSAEVGAVLRDSCEKIDSASGTYDNRGHSPLYGYGRPDVARAVELARARETRTA